MWKSKSGFRRVILLLLVVCCLAAALMQISITKRQRDDDLLAAIKRGDVLSVQHLLDAGADANSRFTRPEPNAFASLSVMVKRAVGINEYFRPTALRLACISGNNDIIASLLRHGADLQECDRNFGTCLAAAISEGHNKAAYYLISQGIDINAHDQIGITPLMWAAEKGNTEVVNVLLEKGADKSATTDMGDTALMRSINDHTGRSTLALLRGGCAVETQNIDQETALHIAARTGKVEPVRYLLDHGANPTVKNKKGLTVLDNLQSLLRQNGRVPTAADQTIMTLLQKHQQSKPSR